MPHAIGAGIWPGSELGELQHAMWKAQFEALRDGDRFHYLWSRPLRRLEGELRRRSGRTGGRKSDRDDTGPATDGLGTLDWRRTLAEVIADNTELGADDLQADVFVVAR